MINLFISDLHLEESRPDIAAVFFKLLKQAVQTADRLYILGDFFEVWIGDDDTSAFNLSVIRALRDATDAGLAIYFMRGNRDFLVGKKFLRATGCQLLPDEHLIQIGDQPILLMHGDTLCTADLAYLKFRKKSHHWFFQKLFLLKNLTSRRLIAANMRAKSKAHTSTSPDYLMDVTQEEVERVMQKHQVLHLIHGHTHRPAQHDFDLNGEPAKRTVLPAWHERGCVLICDDAGSTRIDVLETE